MGKELDNHEKNSIFITSIIIYDLFIYPHPPTVIQGLFKLTSQYTVQLSLQFHMISFSFPSCNIIILCSEFTITNINGFVHMLTK